MKFETKLTKLGIDENEVKSIIANCFCGEINGAYFIDLNKEKKEFIMEVVGNYLDDDSEEFEGWTDIKRIATFCKTFGITEDEIPRYYVMGFNEGGCDIAYTLESNKDVILVLTDDARYENSFVSYAPSQTGEIELDRPVWETDEEIGVTSDMHPSIAELKSFFESIGENTIESEEKINCDVVIRRKGNKYLCEYSDTQKFTKEEIKFLTGRNTGNNIIQKLEMIRCAEIGELGKMTANEKRWDEIGRQCNISFISNLIDELNEIKKEEGKIKISKDFKYEIKLM